GAVPAWRRPQACGLARENVIPYGTRSVVVSPDALRGPPAAHAFRTAALGQARDILWPGDHAADATQQTWETFCGSAAARRQRRVELQMVSDAEYVSPGTLSGGDSRGGQRYGDPQRVHWSTGSGPP